MSKKIGRMKISILIVAAMNLMTFCPLSMVSGQIDFPVEQRSETGDDKVISSPGPRGIGDWPAFRYGETRTGFSNTEGPDAVTVLWQNTTDDVQQGIYSSAAVVDGRVFFGSTNSKFYAYDAVTGKQLWNNTTSSGDYGICSSPVVSNGYVIIYVNNDDSIYSFNVSTGALKWKVATGVQVAGGSSPIVSNGKVYVGAPNGRLYVKNENDGTASWNFQMEGANQPNGLGIISSPAIYNNTVFFGGGDEKLYAVNITTHNKVWAYTLALVGNPSPAVADGVVYYAEGAHTSEDCIGCSIYAFDVDGFADGNDGYSGESSTGTSDGDIIWKKDMTKSTTSSPAVYGNKLFIGSLDNSFYALNKSNGNTIWSYDVGFNIIGSPAVADGKVYIANQNSKLFAFDIDGFSDGNDGWTGEAATGATNGDIIWNYSLGGQAWASPAVSNGVVYIGNTNGKMYAIGTPSVDATPPQLLSTDPVNGAKNISVDKTISARFNEPLGPLSVTSQNVTLRDNSSVQVTGVVTYQALNNEIRFDPSVSLKPHEKYSVTISNIMDGLGNKISAPISWSFTTVNGRPALSSGGVTPGSGTLSTTYQYTVTFTDPDNDLPAGGLKVLIDTDTVGKTMVVNLNASPASLHDGNTANGEGYIYNTTLVTAGSHNFWFKVTDGFDINITQVLSGPQVQAQNKPPVIGAIPDQQVTEDIVFKFDIQPFLSDPDNSTSQLKMEVGSKYLMDTDMFNATFLFPGTAPQSSDIVFNVTDGISKVNTSVRFVVTFVDEPPTLASLDDITINASEPYFIDISSKITDEDTPLSSMSVSTNSSYITVSGLKMNLTYPRTVTKELVNVSVKDNVTTVHGKFWVTVFAPPLNLPPTLDILPDATPIEDIAYSYDLLSKVHDDGLPNLTLELKLVQPSSYVTMEGPFLKMLYPNGVLKDTINFTVSDGEYTISGKVLVKVTAVNDAPQLLNYTMVPATIAGKGGSTRYQYHFSVVYKDMDSPSPKVELVIDGIPYSMNKTGGTADIGMTYRFSIWDEELKKGTHTYLFKANDSSGAANGLVQTPQASFDVTTPTKPKPVSLWAMLPILFILGIVIAVIAVVGALVIINKKKKAKNTLPPTQPQQPDLMQAYTQMPPDQGPLGPQPPPPIS